MLLSYSSYESCKCGMEDGHWAHCVLRILVPFISLDATRAITYSCYVHRTRLQLPDAECCTRRGGDDPPAGRVAGEEPRDDRPGGGGGHASQGRLVQAVRRRSHSLARARHPAARTPPPPPFNFHFILFLICSH